ncbi:fimbrial protein [Serratia marcescens]|uniref:fimbrial protein n=1 Tax=Serratia marcescens TaxID=615 RepID=UPI00217A3CF1|nr:fimbrial protein [Serratia marcescens]CAI1616489.1 P pilus assembly protein, pilin FimA [Serratia marcescens]
MKKHAMNLTLSVLLLSCAGGAFAAGNSASVMVTGRVTDATCDINTQGLTGNKLDLGSHFPGEFKDETTLVGTKSFGVGLSNCSGTESATKHYGLYVSGSSLAVNNKYFADLPAQTVGIALQSLIDPANPTLVPASGMFIPVSTSEKAETADGQLVQFQASMIHPLATAPRIQDVQGTIVFTADYQ